MSNYSNMWSNLRKKPQGEISMKQLTKQALFIHGFNSDEHSSTGAKVKNILQDAGFSTMIKTFDVLSPFKTKQDIEDILREGSFDLLIGHSLGGFYTLIAQLPQSCHAKKIIINPSLAPEQDLQKISTIDEKTLEEFATLNANKRKNTENNNCDNNETETVFALFGKHDELLTDEERQPYIDLFLKHYGKYYVLLECTHRPDEESLKLGLSQALKTLGIA